MLPLLNIDFIIDGIARVIEELLEDSVVLWDISASIVDFRTNFIKSPSKDVKPLSRALSELRSQKHKGFMALASEHKNSAYLAPFSVSTDVVTKSAFLTALCTITVGNVVRSPRRNAWDMKELVESNILLSYSDGVLQAKLTKALNAQNSHSINNFIVTKLKTSSVNIKSFGIPSYKTPEISTPHDFSTQDDDDMFDDGTKSKDDNQNGDVAGDSPVDTAAVVLRTNIFVAVITAVVTAIVALGAMTIYTNRNTGIVKLKRTYQILDESGAFEDEYMDSSRHVSSPMLNRSDVLVEARQPARLPNQNYGNILPVQHNASQPPIRNVVNKSSLLHYPADDAVTSSRSMMHNSADLEFDNGTDDDVTITLGGSLFDSKKGTEPSESVEV